MNRARQRVTDREEARALLSAWKESRMAFRDFCAAHHIDGRSLRSWCNKETDRPLRLVELTPMPEPVHTPPVTYRLTVGAVVLELDDAFQEETLARLLSVLRC